jgi:hypothetical protein
VFVASADAGPVAAYAAQSSGSVAPVLSIQNPNLPNTYWGPWGVAFDTQGNLYVQTFLSDATTFVFAPGASGSDPPIRVFRGEGPDTRCIAIDAAGFAYIASGEGASVIDVIAPGASGQPGNLYTVSPARSIPVDETGWSPWPSILTADSHGDIMAAVVRSQGNAIEVFAGGGSGSSTPIRTITGSQTGLDSCASGGCQTMAISFSQATGRLYVAVNAGQDTHVSVFAGDTSGNVAPVRTIQGPNTGLAGKVVTGIAGSQVTGDIYALVKDAQFGGRGWVSVFGRYASGDVAPMRTFTDSSSQMADAAGIAIHSEASLDVSPPAVENGSRLEVRPNPSRRGVTARFVLPHALSSLRIEALDLQGRRIATLWDADAPAGVLEARWDGRSEGQLVAPGLYVIRATASGLRVDKPVAIIR